MAVVGSAFFARQEVEKAIEQQANFGSVIQTQLTDTIGTFRTNVNSSLTNLAANLATVTSTVNAYGNITAENTPLAVNKGGTGTTTTPLDSQYLMASGTTPTWKTLVASSGITIVYTATTTQFSTPGFDNTANISFTGNNTFSGSSSFNASTTFNNNTIFNGNITFTNQIASTSIPSLAFASTTISTATSSIRTVFENIAGFSLTITTGNHPVLIILSGSAANDTLASSCYFDFSVDGNRVGPDTGGLMRFRSAIANGVHSINTSYITPPLSAGSHTFRTMIRVDANQCNTISGAGDANPVFTVKELY